MREIERTLDDLYQQYPSERPKNIDKPKETMKIIEEHHYMLDAWMPCAQSNPKPKELNQMKLLVFRRINTTDRFGLDTETILGIFPDQKTATNSMYKFRILLQNREIKHHYTVAPNQESYTIVWDDGKKELRYYEIPILQELPDFLVQIVGESGEKWRRIVEDMFK